MQSWFCLGKLPYIPVNAQAPVCGLYKPPSISPVLTFPNGQEKIKGNWQAFTVAIFRLINANYIFLEMTLWYKKNWRFEEF